MITLIAGMAATRVRFEADSLMAAAERQVVRVEYARSLREPPWDGVRFAANFALLRAGRCIAQLECRSRHSGR